MKKGVLNAWEAEKILKKRAFPIAESQFITEKTVSSIKKFPLYLKIISDQAIHKSNIHGVRLCTDAASLQKQYEQLIAIAKKRKLRLQGILAQEIVPGTEIIIGIKKDPVFSHVIMLGIGGTLVELIKDVTFRMCPITKKDALSMIHDLKYKQLLFGYRNSKPVNIDLLTSMLIKVSKLPTKYRNLEELDINPLVINEKTAKIVDARMAFS